MPAEALAKVVPPKTPPAMTDYSRPILDHILLPTDFSVEGQVAFHHALKLALLAKTQLTLLHITPERELDWDEFPSVREPLEHWGLIAPGSPKRPSPIWA
jgi:hypothetical protein